MIGRGVLLECLDDDRIASVLAIGRTSAGVQHPKLREIVRADLFDLAPLAGELAGIDACFFCLGVSAVGMTEDEYRRLTNDLTLAVANVLPKGITFCYTSAEGADGTGKSRQMWARVRGRTENELLAMPFKAYIFRPGLIQPMRGVRSRTNVYARTYDVIGFALPLVRKLAPALATTTVNVGRAMIRVALEGCPKKVLFNRDINRLAEGAAVH